MPRPRYPYPKHSSTPLEFRCCAGSLVVITGARHDEWSTRITDRLRSHPLPVPVERVQDRCQADAARDPRRPLRFGRDRNETLPPWIGSTPTMSNPGGSISSGSSLSEQRPRSMTTRRRLPVLRSHLTPVRPGVVGALGSHPRDVGASMEVSCRVGRQHQPGVISELGLRGSHVTAPDWGLGEFKPLPGAHSACDQSDRADHTLNTGFVVA